MNFSLKELQEHPVFQSSPKEKQQAMLADYFASQKLPESDDPFRFAIQHAAQETNVPEDLIRAVIQTESSGNPRAVSPVGARGLMQLMPGTAKEVGVDDPFDPWQNIHGGARYLAKQLERSKGNVVKALASYNAGPGRVDQAIIKGRGRWTEFLPTETQQYIKKVTSLRDKLGRSVLASDMPEMVENPPPGMLDALPLPLPLQVEEDASGPKVRGIRLPTLSDFESAYGVGPDPQVSLPEYQMMEPDIFTDEPQIPELTGPPEPPSFLDKIGKGAIDLLPQNAFRPLIDIADKLPSSLVNAILPDVPALKEVLFPGDVDESGKIDTRNFTTSALLGAALPTSLMMGKATPTLPGRSPLSLTDQSRPVVTSRDVIPVPEGEVLPPRRYPALTNIYEGEVDVPRLSSPLSLPAPPSLIGASEAQLPVKYRSPSPGKSPTQSVIELPDQSRPLNPRRADNGQFISPKQVEKTNITPSLKSTLQPGDIVEYAGKMPNLRGSRAQVFDMGDGKIGLVKLGKDGAPIPGEKPKVTSSSTSYWKKIQISKQKSPPKQQTATPKQGKKQQAETSPGPLPRQEETILPVEKSPVELLNDRIVLLEQKLKELLPLQSKTPDYWDNLQLNVRIKAIRSELDNLIEEYSKQRRAPIIDALEKE